MLVGEGSEQSLTASVVHDLGLDKVVEMVTWQPDVSPFLRELDIFIHPSRREPFGLAVVEAMAARLPVIAWREGGACEIVSDGVTGLLVEPEDHAALADALIRLARNGDERRMFGDAAAALPSILHPLRLAERSPRRCTVWSAQCVNARGPFAVQQRMSRWAAARIEG